MASVSKGGTLPDTGVTKNEIYALVDNATVTSIVDADISNSAAITDSKLASITTSAKVNRSAITGDTGGIEYIVDGGGDPITTGVKGYIEIPFACTLTSAKMFLDTSAVTTFDIWKDTYGNFPPTSADSMVSAVSGDTTFSTSGASAVKYSATISNAWTKAITANDIIAISCSANDNATRATIVLNYTRP